MQTANADKLYSAVDLLDFSLKVDGVVYVAHDARLPVPDWLQQQFRATEMTLAVNGQPMKVFERHVRSGESLTLGSNTENRQVKSCNMYLVFVKSADAAAPRRAAEFARRRLINLRSRYHGVRVHPTPTRRLAWLAGIFLSAATAVLADGTNVEWLMRPWQTEDGLPDNSVNGLAQTEDGYLWVGTPTGLARFDGIHFENIPLTNVITMPNHGIVTMLRGRHGALWLAMDRGALVRLSGKDLARLSRN